MARMDEFALGNQTFGSTLPFKSTAPGMNIDTHSSTSSGATSANKQPGSSINMNTLGKMPTYTPPPAGSMVKSVSAPKLGGGMRMGSFMLGGGGGMGLGRID
jgi:hypothetical protein